MIHTKKSWNIGTHWCIFVAVIDILMTTQIKWRNTCVWHLSERASFSSWRYWWSFSSISWYASEHEWLNHIYFSLWWHDAFDFPIVNFPTLTATCHKRVPTVFFSPKDTFVRRNSWVWTTTQISTSHVKSSQELCVLLCVCNYAHGSLEKNLNTINVHCSMWHSSDGECFCLCVQVRSHMEHRDWPTGPRVPRAHQRCLLSDVLALWEVPGLRFLRQVLTCARTPVNDCWRLSVPPWIGVGFSIGEGWGCPVDFWFFIFVRFLSCWFRNMALMCYTLKILLFAFLNESTVLIMR